MLPTQIIVAKILVTMKLSIKAPRAMTPKVPKIEQISHFLMNLKTGDLRVLTRKNI